MASSRSRRCSRPTGGVRAGSSTLVVGRRERSVAFQRSSSSPRSESVASARTRRSAWKVASDWPNGREVVEQIGIEIEGGRIVRQTDVEAWDPAENEGDRLVRWLEAYGRAWEEHDGDAAAELFSEDAVYAWGPWEELRGRDAIRWRWRETTAEAGPVQF